MDLIGVAAYREGDKMSVNKRKTMSEKEIANRAPSGHYTAYVYRRGNTSWMEIDDLCNQQRYHKGTNKIVPRIMYYVKTDVYENE